MAEMKLQLLNLSTTKKDMCTCIKTFQLKLGRKKDYPWPEIFPRQIFARILAHFPKKANLDIFDTKIFSLYFYNIQIFVLYHGFYHFNMITIITIFGNISIIIIIIVIIIIIIGRHINHLRSMAYKEPTRRAFWLKVHSRLRLVIMLLKLS